MSSAVRRAGNRDLRRIKIAIRIVHDPTDHRAKVDDFQVQISEIDLSPRLAKPASRIPENRIAIPEQLAGDIARAAFAARITMYEGDERKRAAAGRYLEPRVEGRTVVADQKPVVRSAGGPAWGA